ncbi:hypothetical protein IT398_02110 [Candidatus Nomurabacteria bacterium]|nr:hypothetical protein [Candidatus Nomurabacteria bacterium]
MATTLVSEMSLEEMCRQLLSVAVRDGLVSTRDGVVPTDLSCGDLVGMANYLSVLFTANLTVRKVKVNRNRSPQEAIEATGRTQYTDRQVVNAMPKGEGDEAEIVFFKPDLSERNSFISDDDLEKEFELRGLKPADPVSVAAVNEADPAFADQVPHGTHWKDDKGNWCHVTFHLWFDEREVCVGRGYGGWHDDAYFAGVRK